MPGVIPGFAGGQQPPMSPNRPHGNAQNGQGVSGPRAGIVSASISTSIS